VSCFFAFALSWVVSFGFSFFFFLIVIPMPRPRTSRIPDKFLRFRFPPPRFESSCKAFQEVSFACIVSFLLFFFLYSSLAKGFLDASFSINWPGALISTEDVDLSCFQLSDLDWGPVDFLVKAEAFSGFRALFLAVKSSQTKASETLAGSSKYVFVLSSYPFFIFFFLGHFPVTLLPFLGC